MGEFYGTILGNITNVQELILDKSHRNTKTWCIQHKTLIIKTSKLTNYRRVLLIVVCLFVLLRIKRVYTTHHVIKLTNRTKFNKINIINALIEKWMMCDALWAP